MFVCGVSSFFPGEAASRSWWYEGAGGGTIIGVDRGERFKEEPDFRSSFRRRFRSYYYMLMAFVSNVTRASAVKFSVLLLLLATIAAACAYLPVDKILKNFLIWVKDDLGPWGPIVLALAYIPLTVLAVPASILTLGGGYLFGLPVGFIADSIGATLGATAAFLLGRTFSRVSQVGRSYVMSKLKNYPKFQAVAVAIRRDGFKIVLLLRLVPLLPFNMMNYLLSVTPVHVGHYMLASWFGMMPITFALVYIGTTLKDLSDVTHGWGEVSTTRWVFMVFGFVMSALLIACILKIAKSSLEKALAENSELDEIMGPSMLPIVAESPLDIQSPLIIKIDLAKEDNDTR
ncbi:hypothetical protein ACFE04_012227 [Oxalis oulophora]